MQIITTGQTLRMTVLCLVLHGTSLPPFPGSVNTMSREKKDFRSQRMRKGAMKFCLLSMACCSHKLTVAKVVYIRPTQD